MDRPATESTRREERRAFLQALFREPARIGAVAPSSVHLARAMVRGLRLEPGQTLVEFGPGTGAVTAEIRRILPSPSSYLGVEIEPRLAALVRQRFPGLQVIEGSAEEAPRFVADAGCTDVKAIICGLPFATLPASVQEGVVRAVDALVGPGAEFRTFQYIHAYPLPPAVRFRRRMREVFGPHTREATVVRNLPPAYVLSWSR